MSNIFFHFLLSRRPLRSNANPDFCYSAADSIMLITYQCFKFESNKVVYTFQIFHKMIAVLTLFFKLSSLKNPYIYSSCIHLASTHDYYCSCLSQRIIMLQLANPILSLTGILFLCTMRSVQSHFCLHEICTTLVFFLLSISISCSIFCLVLRMYFPP